MTLHADKPVAAASTPAPAAFRAIQVLDALALSPHASTITEIASAIPLAKSSVSNLLVTLEAAGMVRRAPSGWTLAYKALELGQSVLASTDLVAEFRRIVASMPYLKADTTLLAVLDGTDVLYLARHDGQQQVRLASDIGRRLPAVVTSLGKAMLATLPEDELERRLATVEVMPRPTRRSHRTIDDLHRDLAAIRIRGYAVDDEQNTIGVTCFGVALAGEQPTAVSTTLLSQRITPDLQDHIIRELRQLATQLTPFARAG
ncbi:MAG: IclR family transcriptional regulator [Salinibacterium sp.]|nr:IclR family transcriptional regulator [Salinibacterium sp.]